MKLSNILAKAAAVLCALSVAVLISSGCPKSSAKEAGDMFDGTWGVSGNDMVKYVTNLREITRNTYKELGGFPVYIEVDVVKGEDGIYKVEKKVYQFDTAFSRLTQTDPPDMALEMTYNLRYDAKATGSVKNGVIYLTDEKGGRSTLECTDDGNSIILKEGENMIGLKRMSTEEALKGLRKVAYTDIPSRIGSTLHHGPDAYVLKQVTVIEGDKKQVFTKKP